MEFTNSKLPHNICQKRYSALKLNLPILRRHICWNYRYSKDYRKEEEKSMNFQTGIKCWNVIIVNPGMQNKLREAYGH